MLNVYNFRTGVNAQKVGGWEVGSTHFWGVPCFARFLKIGVVIHKYALYILFGCSILYTYKLCMDMRKNDIWKAKPYTYKIGNTAPWPPPSSLGIAFHPSKNKIQKNSKLD